VLRVITRNIPVFSRQDIWFFKGENIPFLNNNLFYHSFSLPKDKNIVEVTKVYTTSLDITQPLESIRSNFHKKLRGYINKGDRTNFTYKILNISDEKIQKYLLEEYNCFALNKHLDTLNAKWFYTFCKSNKIFASQILFKNQALVIHIYLYDECRVRLQFSFHLHEVEKYSGQFRGLANRYLHWLDVIYAKNTKFEIYDFGGIPMTTLESLLSFKLSFGGFIEEQYSFILLKGYYIIFYKLKKKFQKYIKGVSLCM